MSGLVKSNQAGGTLLGAHALQAKPSQARPAQSRPGQFWSGRNAWPADDDDDADSTDWASDTIQKTKNYFPVLGKKKVCVCRVRIEYQK